MSGRQIARQHHTHLVREDFFAFVVNDTAAVAITVKGETYIGTCLQHLVPYGMEHLHIFRVRIVAGEGVVQLAIKGDHLNANAVKNCWCKYARGAIAAGSNHFQFALDLGAIHKVRDVAFSHIIHIRIAAPRARLIGAVQNDFAERTHLVWTKGQRARSPHFDAGPAVFIMAGRDHGNGRGIEVELGEIGHWGKRRADILDRDPGLHQPQHQRIFD